MKDHLGNDALDYGIRRDLQRKYTDNSFVYITKEMFKRDEGYVLFITDHHDKAWDWKMDFVDRMKKEEKIAFVSVEDGNNYYRKRMEGFMGGIF